MIDLVREEQSNKNSIYPSFYRKNCKKDINPNEQEKNQGQKHIQESGKSASLSQFVSFVLLSYLDSQKIDKKNHATTLEGKAAVIEVTPEEEPPTDE